MEPPVIFFNSIILIIAILVILLPVIVKSIARLLGKGKKKEAQKQPAEAAVQLFKDTKALSQERIQSQLTESGEWLPEHKQAARNRIKQLPPLQRAVIWSEILAEPVGMKEPRLY